MAQLSDRRFRCRIYLILPGAIFEEARSMTKAIAAGSLVALLLAGAAYAADPVVYTWTGYGVNVQGSSKCPTYKMTIEVTVTGQEVKGKCTQEGRTERTFET